MFVLRGEGPRASGICNNHRASSSRWAIRDLGLIMDLSSEPRSSRVEKLISRKERRSHTHCPHLLHAETVSHGFPPPPSSSSLSRDVYGLPSRLITPALFKSEYRRTYRTPKSPKEASASILPGPSPKYQGALVNNKPHTDTHTHNGQTVRLSSSA
jgi:hypothetical protein